METLNPARSVVIITLLILFSQATWAAKPTPAGRPPRQILFLCTGNFYRSRAAEAVFNFEAEQAGLPWRARSRGLKTSLLSAEERQLRVSPLVVAKLNELKIPRSYLSADPVAAIHAELAKADCLVAMSKREHQPYLTAAYQPVSKLKLVYWDVEDIERVSADQALGTVVGDVRRLVDDLKHGRGPAACL